MTNPGPVDAAVAARRDVFADFVRAGSLVVVVAWHWAFTVLVWKNDGPHATNPIGFTSGLWLVTWVLQVMPLFFFVGGWANWSAHTAKGTRSSRFALSRLRRLLLPAVALIGAWWCILIAVSQVIDGAWLRGSVILVLSPLWFAFTYALIVALFPLWVRLHRRFSYLVPLWMAGIAALVDVARFEHDISYVGWVNMILVWGLCHQLGFFYPTLMALPRRAGWAITYVGAVVLTALVWSGLYPGSMVGVPGDKFSNMAPPTVAIVALITLQIGVLILVRPWVTARLERPRWTSFTRLLTTYSMPLYLLHSSGLAVYLVAVYLINGRQPMAAEISLTWWLTRPLALTLPLLTTVPLIWAVGRLTARRNPSGPNGGQGRAPSVAATTAPANSTPAQ
jgi:hypothetical protein